MCCIQCGQDIAKYKCPICRKPYCSVACCKQHKETPCSAPPPPVKETPTDELVIEYDYPTEDTVSLEKLNLLEKSAGLKKCIENPYVREILEILDKATHPDGLIQEYMQEPIFIEFVDECLKVVNPKEDET